MAIEFKKIEHGSEAWKTAVALRESILRIPLGSTFSQEELEEEKNHIQVVGYREGELIATAALVPEAGKLKMQRVVVAGECRNQGVGTAMMNYCMDLAKEGGYSTLYCHARDSAVRFYTQNNYQTVGDYFDEDGIPHVKMEIACS